MLGTEKIKRILGDKNYLDNPEEMLPYLTSWRGGYKGNSPLVALPNSVSQIQEIVKICAAEKILIIPQGGNTGLVAGSVPVLGNEIIINLSRLNKIRHIDKMGFCITAEAGVVLQKLQETAAENGMLFPLSMASEGSAEIGGVVSTNAGGTAVLRYGNMRDLLLGLEVVLPNGNLLKKLPHVKKDNTGYDLKQIFIGAEGTLGIITAASLKLFPQPREKATAFLGLDNLQDAIAILHSIKSAASDELTAFEFISAEALELVLQEHNLRNPLSETSAYYLLIELSSFKEISELHEFCEKILAQAFEKNLIRDAAIAASLAQGKEFWFLRENIAESARKAGKGIHFDISVPIAKIPEFIQKTTAAALKNFPNLRSFPFGHIGDGNIHYNFYLPPGIADADFAATKKILKKIVYDSVVELEGSISAEHGIGLERKEDFLLYKPALEIELMRKLKASFDPNNIMNPGKIF